MRELEMRKRREQKQIKVVGCYVAAAERANVNLWFFFSACAKPAC